LKVALVADGETVTEDGTDTAALLLDKETLNPPAGAAAERVTVHSSESLPVMDAVVQFNELRETVDVPPEAPEAFFPEPFRLTFKVGLVGELLKMVSSPFVEPCCLGL
jgi:hypothetical protein